jgi:hypothetical protein
VSTALAPIEQTDSLAVVESEGSAPSEARGLVIPYVDYFGGGIRNADKIEALTAAGVKPGDFYLHHITPIPLKPFDLHLLKYARLYTKQNNAMDITDVVVENSDARFAEGYREHLFCTVAVRLPVYGPDGKPTGQVSLVPAILTLRSGMTKALTKAMSAWPYAAKPESWAARGAAYAQAARAVYPGGRMIVTIWAEPEDTADGNTFNKGYGAIRPSSGDDADNFNTWVTDARPFINKVIAP